MSQKDLAKRKETPTESHFLGGGGRIPTSRKSSGRVGGIPGRRFSEKEVGFLSRRRIYGGVCFVLCVLLVSTGGLMWKTSLMEESVGNGDKDGDGGVFASLRRSFVSEEGDFAREGEYLKDVKIGNGLGDVEFGRSVDDIMRRRTFILRKSKRVEKWDDGLRYGPRGSQYYKYRHHPPLPQPFKTDWIQPETSLRTQQKHQTSKRFSADEFLCKKNAKLPEEDVKILEILGPVDIVYTWVNGSDVELLNEQALWNYKLYRLNVTVDPARISDHGELRHSLRSLWKYVDWFRHVYIITNDRIPLIG